MPNLSPACAMLVSQFLIFNFLILTGLTQLTSLIKRFFSLALTTRAKPRAWLNM